MDRHLTEFEALRRVGITLHPQTVTRLVQIAHWIQRDRFEEDDKPLFLARQPHGLAQHQRRVGTV